MFPIYNWKIYKNARYTIQYITGYRFIETFKGEILVEP